MYNGDSFFTLSGVGQAALALLSVVMAALLFWAVRKLPGVWWVRLSAAIVIFYLFVWLSPQVYYQYYRLIIPGLPAQWVIGAAPRLPDITTLLSFTGAFNLSSHGQGVLGWALALGAVLRKHRDAALQRIDSE